MTLSWRDEPLRRSHLSAESRPGGYQPDGLATAAGQWQQHPCCLHYLLQIAMGWSDDHLNRFVIHGKEYGVYHSGGIGFSDDPETVQLADLGV